MCKEHLIAKNTIRRFVSSKKTFTYNQVQRKIIKNGGILRVSIGFTVSDYLDKLEERGIVEYIPKKDSYVARKEIAA